MMIIRYDNIPLPSWQTNSRSDDIIKAHTSTDTDTSTTNISEVILDA